MDPSALESVSRCLESSLDRWGGWILASTAVVVIGLAVEYWEPIRDFIKLWRRPGAAFPRKKLAELVGGILITLGVAGELGFTYKASRVESALRENNHKIEESLNASADSAAKAADRANKSADAVGKKADALDIRLEVAAKRLGILEEDITAEGPRWILLEKAGPGLVKNLVSFARQRVRLFVCGQLGSQDGETLSTWGAIAQMLSTDGAKWKVEHGGLEYFDRCSPSGAQPQGQGIMVFVNQQASGSTMEAAEALGKGLAKALPPSPNKMPALVDADFSKKYRQPIEGKDTPWAMVANDPDLITVLIGAHPQVEATTLKTKANH